MAKLVSHDWMANGVWHLVPDEKRSNERAFSQAGHRKALQARVKIAGKGPDCEFSWFNEPALEQDSLVAKTSAIPIWESNELACKVEV